MHIFHSMQLRCHMYFTITKILVFKFVNPTEAKVMTGLPTLLHIRDWLGNDFVLSNGDFSGEGRYWFRMIRKRGGDDSCSIFYELLDFTSRLSLNWNLLPLFKNSISQGFFFPKKCTKLLYARNSFSLCLLQ